MAALHLHAPASARPAQVVRAGLLRVRHAACTCPSNHRHLPRAAAARRQRVHAAEVAQEAEVEQVEEAAPAPAADAEPAAEEGQGAEAEAEAGATPAAERPAADAPKEAGSYTLNFLWLDKNVAVSVDQMFSKTQRSPLTEYYFWPTKDAWEELKAALEAKPWVSERDKVLLLNKTTEVINFWQEETKHSLQEARDQFPDCEFQGQ